jgi:hypothetical protein
MSAETLQKSSAPAADAQERHERLVSIYLQSLMQAFDAPLERARLGRPDACRTGCEAKDIAEILSSRRFSHLSKSQASSYQPAMLMRLQADMDKAQPLRFFYDLEGDYHAGLQPDFSGHRFVPGLGELLALRQIRWLAQAVEQVYPPGLRFTLVIDDLCAWASNDIALDKTAGYVAQLHRLIGAVRLQATVDVLAESALCSSARFGAAVQAGPATAPEPQLSLQTLENVRRFVGRACTPTEALRHRSRYQRAQAVSDRLLAPHIQGVRLTQRASDTCMGFRSFPGGDLRLQTGAVVLTVGPGEVVRPLLLTSRNVGGHAVCALPPAALPHNWPLAAGDAQLALRRVGHATPSFGSPAPANPRHPQ